MSLRHVAAAGVRAFRVVKMRMIVRIGMLVSPDWMVWCGAGVRIVCWPWQARHAVHGAPGNMEGSGCCLLGRVERCRTSHSGRVHNLLCVRGAGHCTCTHTHLVVVVVVVTVVVALPCAAGWLGIGTYCATR